MEHELFQSKLKTSVEGGLVPEIIRSSSSGLNSHRTAAMELLFERSIQERRERMCTKAKHSLRSDPAKGVSEEPIIPVLKTKAPVPVPAPQPPQPPQPPHLPPSSAIIKIFQSAFANHEPPQDSPERVKKTKVANREDPPVNVRPNPSPEDAVPDLVCRSCGVEQLRKSLRSGIHCGWCFVPSTMKCVGCGAYRNRVVEVCTCSRKFK